jgi:hypothetical protein
MKGEGDDNELDDDDEDEEELSGLEEVQSDSNEQVRIWLDGCTSSLDFTPGDKGDIEMLGIQSALYSDTRSFQYDTNPVLSDRKSPV